MSSDFFRIIEKARYKGRGLAEHLLSSGTTFEACVFKISRSDIHGKSENIMKMIKKIEDGFFIVMEDQDHIEDVTYFILGGNIIGGDGGEWR